MDILINDAGRLCEIINQSLDESLTDDEKQQVCQLIGIEPESVDYKRVNIGPGADVWVLLSTLKNVAEVVGVVIGVAEIISKFRKIVSKLKECISRNELESMDEEGAKVLARDYIIHHFKCDSMELVSSNVTTLFGGGSYVEYEDHPIAQSPHRYYVLSYRLDNLDTVVLGITSFGKINVVKAFAFNPYGITEMLEECCEKKRDNEM